MVHDTANIYDSAKIGEGTKVGAFAEIGRDVVVGSNCSIGCGVFIPENVIVGDNVFLGPHVVFTNDKHAPSNGAWRSEPPTIVEDDVSIGANATILPNITLGRGCKIGAGSVVTKSGSPGAVVAGNPARDMKKKSE